MVAVILIQARARRGRRTRQRRFLVPRGRRLL